MYGFPPGTECQEDGRRPFQPPSTSVYCMIDGKTACKRWHFALQKVTFYMAKCRQSPCNQRPFRGFSAIFRPFFCYFYCTLQRSFRVTLSISSSCVCTLLLSVFPPKGFCFPATAFYSVNKNHGVSHQLFSVYKWFAAALTASYIAFYIPLLYPLRYKIMQFPFNYTLSGVIKVCN